jgi:hypothetical protein
MSVRAPRLCAPQARRSRRPRPPSACASLARSCTRARPRTRRLHQPCSTGTASISGSAGAHGGPTSVLLRWPRRPTSTGTRSCADFSVRSSQTREQRSRSRSASPRSGRAGSHARRSPTSSTCPRTSFAARTLTSTGHPLTEGKREPSCRPVAGPVTIDAVARSAGASPETTSAHPHVGRPRDWIVARDGRSALRAAAKAELRRREHRH